MKLSISMYCNHHLDHNLSMCYTCIRRFVDKQHAYMENNTYKNISFKKWGIMSSANVELHKRTYTSADVSFLEMHHKMIMKYVILGIIITYPSHSSTLDIQFMP